MWGNTVAIHNVLKKKNYKAKFSTSLIWKNKIDKDNSEKKNTKKWKKKKKTILEKKKAKKKKWKKKGKQHTGKVKAKFPTSSKLKKKSDKDNFEKKTYGENTIAKQKPCEETL